MELEEQRCVIEKARRKNRWSKAKSGFRDGESFVKHSLSDFNFKARQQAILYKSEVTIKLGALVGVDTVGPEEEIITDLS
ncbi:hypothetical protein V6N13_141691 [Hibiscus sabdariffa]